MSSSIPLQIAETIQTASINRNPSPTHDLNPSTAASEKLPVTVVPSTSASEPSLDKYAYDEEDGIDEDDDEEDIPYSVIKPLPRRASFGPLPDLRFEQSYLASIAGAESYGRIAFITIRDQVSQFSLITSRHDINSYLDIPTSSARHGMVLSATRMEILE